jgi:hypothetical protein
VIAALVRFVDRLTRAAVALIVDLARSEPGAPIAQDEDEELARWDDVLND